MRLQPILRRGAFALLALLLVLGMAALATQTPHFREWARGLAERQAARLVNGEVAIGRLEGNLFTGAELSDVTIRQDGREIITIPRATARYDFRRLLRSDLALTNVTLVRPSIVLVHDDSGWRIGKLLRRRPGAPPSRRIFVIQSLAVEDGTVTVDDIAAASNGSKGVGLPKRFDGLHADLALAAGGGQVDLDFTRATFRTHKPALDVRSLSGRLVNGNGLFQLDQFRIRTAQSGIDLDGWYQNRNGARRLQATVAASPLNVDEFATYLPWLAGRALSPTFTVSLDGPFDALETHGTFTEPTIGSIRSDVTVDLRAPNGVIPVRGAAAVERLNLATLLNRKALASRLTATASLDLTISTPWSRDAVAGKVVLHSRTSEFAGYRYDTIDGPVRLNGRRLTVAVNTRAYGARARVTGTFTFGVRDNGVAYNLRGHVDDVDLRRLPPQLRIPRLESYVAGTYTAIGAGSRLDGTLTFDSSTVEGALIDAGSRGRIDIGGQIPQYGFDGRVVDLDLSRIGRTFEIQYLDGDRFSSRLTGHVALEGTGSNLGALRLDAVTELEPSSIFDATLRSASIRAHIEDRQLTASALGEFASLDPATLIGREELQGEVAGTFDVRTAVSGLGEAVTMDSISGDGSLRLERSTVGPLTFDMAQLQGRYADRAGEVTSLNILGPQLEITASGPFALGDSGESNLTYHVVHGHLEDLAPVVGRDIAGRLRLDGVISGNRAHLASTGTSTLAPVRVESTVDALEVTSTFEASMMDFSPTSLRVTAEIESLLVTVAGRNLRSLTATLDYADSELEFTSTIAEAGRTATAMGRLVTLANAREVRVDQLAVEAAGVTWSNRPGQGFTARYGRNGLLTFSDVVLTSGNQLLTTEGSLSLSPEVDGSLDVRFEQVDLAGLGTLLLVPRTLGGVLNGSGRVTGSSSDRLITGKVAVANGAVDGFRFESLDTSVRVARGRVGVEALLRQAPGAELTIDGELPSSTEGPAANEPLDLYIKSDGIDLALLDAATAATEKATGQLLVDLHVAGTAAAPRMDGSLKVQNGAFTVASTGTEYSSATLDVSFEGDQLRIDALNMLDDNGQRLDGSGNLRVEGRRVEEIDLTIQANEFKVLGNELGDLSVDTTLNVYGSLLAPKVAGLVRVHEGRLEMDAWVDRFTSNAYALPSSEDTSDEDDARDPGGPTLDIAVEVPGNLILRGRDIRPADSAVALGDVNVTVGGDFNIRRVMDGEPVLLGTVTAVRGTYGFQGRQFELLRDGTIAFRGERPIDPALNLQAERAISGIVAHVNIGGTMRSPNLVLTSRPPLEEADILSLILFNEPVNRLAVGQREALGERAVGLASGFVVSPISDTLEHALNVDLFEIEATTDDGGPAITLGEQVGERLFVKFRQIFGTQDASEFQLEYQLADFLRLQGSFSEGKGRANRSLTRRVERGGIDLVVFFSY